MNTSQLFFRTRWRLASWYAGVMGLILGLAGLAVYEASAHAHRITLDRELVSVASILREGLQMRLDRRHQLTPGVWKVVPDFCKLGDRCAQSTTQGRSNSPYRSLSRDEYYLYLLDVNGEPVGFAGTPPPGLDFEREPKLQTFETKDQGRYRQVMLTLRTNPETVWGYLVVGRSLQEFDEYLNELRWVLLIGLPVSLGLIGSAAWWLAGRAMQPVYQSYRQIQQFTTDAAHELRTPLAAARATVESFLRSPHLSETDAREALKTLERQNLRLSQLVQDLLLLAQIEQQGHPQRQEWCDLSEILNDVTMELMDLAKAAGVALKLALDETAAVKILGDDEQIYRLVFNLTVNAIQHTPPEGSVTLHLTSSNNQAVLRVIDTGVGIAPEHQQHIFDRFYRVDSDRSRHTGGSGLGLAIAARIVQSHHGSLQVHSSPGNGSTFTVRFALG